MVADGRGRPVRLLDPYRAWLAGGLAGGLAGDGSEIPRETLDRIVADASEGAARDRRVILWGVGVLVAAVVITGGGIAASVVRGGPSAMQDLVSSLWFTGPALVPMLVVGVWLPLWGARRRRLTRVMGAMLRHGHCPGCGYSLAGLSAGGDGLVACPECGAAWDAEGAAHAAGRSAPPANRPVARAVTVAMVAALGLLVLASVLAFFA